MAATLFLKEIGNAAPGSEVFDKICEAMLKKLDVDLSYIDLSHIY